MQDKSVPFDVAQAHRALRRADPVLAGVMRHSPRYPAELQRTDNLFHSLARSIVYQQLSGKAAGTIFGRVKALYAPKRFPSPADVLAADEDVLRGAGLSWNKIRAFRDLAAKVEDGTVPTMRRVQAMPDDEIIARLTEVRGIGVWTVEMLLIFRLGRPDVLPIGDLGIRKGFMLAYGHDEMPTPGELLEFGERWRPWRSVASWYMWRSCEK